MAVSTEFNNGMPGQKPEYNVQSTEAENAFTADQESMDAPKSDGFTRLDRRDMKRMGKEQELRRMFRPLSALSFVVVLQGTWEIMLNASSQGLFNGGLAGLLWSYVWTFFGLGLVILSLAEMSSMAPTSGGQYHWVSEFAPPKYQRFWSYLAGWLSTLAWQANTASGPFIVGVQIQAIVAVNYPNYEVTNWRGTCMVFVVALMIWGLNIWAARGMPVFQNVMLVCHVGGFLATIIIMWVLAPKNSAEVVFTQFTNGGDWSSTGVSVMIGQITAIYALTCSDAAAHIAEEVKDAGITVPQAMIGSYVVNGVVGFIFLVSYLFTIVDLEGALADPSGFPYLFVFQNAFSLAGVNALSILVIVLTFAGCVSFNLSTSRQTWAFARDGGLPFSKFLARVDPALQVPVGSITMTCIITCLLSCINFGSNTAFNAIISLGLVALMLTYSICIGCVLFRRISHPELLPNGSWTLGRWGIPVNAVAFIYSIFAFFWIFWPPSTPVTLEYFNWAPVMFVGVLVICIIYYFSWGKHQYRGPVVLVEGWRGSADRF